MRKCISVILSISGVWQDYVASDHPDLIDRKVEARFAGHELSGLGKKEAG
jgi:hypothetical protein